MRTFVTTLVIIAVAIAPQLSASHAAPPVVRYAIEPGPHEVRTLDPLVLRDAAREKDLQCTVRLPRDAGAPVPLIVFSHGAGGDRRAFAELSARWASWGYAVVHPTHSDSVRLRMEEGEDIPDVRREMRNIVSKVDLPDRVADVRFILDSIGAIEAAGSVRIDRDRIAMAGHSAGAMTTQIVSGVKVRAARRFGGRGSFLSVSSVADPRIKCAMVISGQRASRLFSDDSWSDLDLPMLVITGSKDNSIVSDETPESRRAPYDLAKPGTKHLLFIEGATHSSYQGRQSEALLGLLGEEAPAEPDMIVEATTSATTAFLDAYLKSDASARNYLRSQDLSVSTNGKAVLSHK